MKAKRRDDSALGGGVSGILKGLTDLIEKLEDLGGEAQELSRTGEIHGKGDAKDVKGVFGFTVKVGLGDQGVRVEPFGNVRTDKTSGKAIVQEMREPMVDVFEEKDFVLVVAEMPGVDADDIELDVQEDVLTVSAKREDRKYRKEVLLPGSFRRDRMTVSCNNGVVEIKCQR